MLQSVGQVVVAASEFELRLHERSDMKHDRGARQTMNRTEVATSVFVRTISLMDDVAATDTDDVEL